MLKEFKDLYQRPGERRRRCFTDDTFELYFFYEPDGRIHSFHLLYLFKNDPMRALLWSLENGYRHCAIDDGEADAFTYGMSRLFTGTQTKFDKRAVLARFEDESKNLEASLRDLVIRHLQAYPG